MKKLASLILSILMAGILILPTGIAFASSGGNTSSGGTSTDDDDGNRFDPKVYIVSSNAPVFSAGEIASIPFSLSTVQGTAFDVRMKLTCEEKGYENAFNFYSTSKWLSLDSVYTEKTPIKPFVQVSGSIPDGTYKVTANFEYTQKGDNYSSKDTFSITVHGRAASVLQIPSASFKGGAISSENKAKLTVNLKNTYVTDFTNVSISLNTAASEGFTLYENFNPVNIDRIEAGKTANPSFSVYVNSTVLSGNYPLTFDISYKDGANDPITIKEVVPVEVERTADANGKNGNTPRIIVANYKTDVEEIKAGQTFTLDFSLKNTSAITTVSNIKVVLSSVTTGSSTGGTSGTSSEVFFPAEGSNSFYISSIAPQGVSAQTIKLMAKQDIEPGIYAVLIKLDYEDDSGKTIPASEETIAFPVSQEQRLEIQGMSIPTDSMGTSVPISFQYINKGKATIYNLSVAVEGDFSLSGGSQYIGNLTAGYNDYFDNSISANGEGPLKGTILLKYEDASGNEQEHRTDFDCNVVAQSDVMGDGNGGMLTPAGPGGMEPAGGTNLVLWIGIPVVALIIAALATIIIIKRKKAKKALVEDEED